MPEIEEYAIGRGDEAVIVKAHPYVDEKGANWYEVRVGDDVIDLRASEAERIGRLISALDRGVKPSPRNYTTIRTRKPQEATA